MSSVKEPFYKTPRWDHDFIMHNRQRGNRSGSRLTDADGRVHRGFTLVELLVVMAIIATLLSIVAPKYFNSLDRSTDCAPL